MNRKDPLLDCNCDRGPGSLGGSCFSLASDTARQRVSFSGVPVMTHTYQSHGRLTKTPMLPLRKYLCGTLDEDIDRLAHHRLQGQDSVLLDVFCGNKVSTFHDLILGIVVPLCWPSFAISLCFSFFRFGNIFLLSCARNSFMLSTRPSGSLGRNSIGLRVVRLVCIFFVVTIANPVAGMIWLKGFPISHLLHLC